MKNFTTHSKSGLFLMEMIFVLLFLGLTCGICVRLFAASYQSRQKAREYPRAYHLHRRSAGGQPGAFRGFSGFISRWHSFRGYYFLLL